MNFFMPMRPPTVTHHDKQLHAYMKGGKPCAVLHDTPELKAARAKLHAALAPFAPAQPMTGAVQLVVKWLFPAEGTPERQLENLEARHRQSGKGLKGRNDPPAFLAR